MQTIDCVVAFHFINQPGQLKSFYYCNIVRTELILNSTFPTFTAHISKQLSLDFSQKNQLQEENTELNQCYSQNSDSSEQSLTHKGNKTAALDSIDIFQ